MLVDVEVDAAFVEGDVGLFEVGEVCVFECVAFVFQDGVYALFEEFAIGPWGGANFDGFGVVGVVGGLGAAGESDA